RAVGYLSRPAHSVWYIARHHRRFRSHRPEYFDRQYHLLDRSGVRLLREIAMPNNIVTSVIASGQNNKYHTSNDADSELDAALSGGLTLDFTGGAIALTQAQYTSAM